MALTMANRRAARPRHLAGSDSEARPVPGSGRPSGFGALAVVGVLLLVGAAVATIVALWPGASGDDVGLEASGDVTTTESPIGGGTEQASASRTDASGTEAPSTTGSTESSGPAGSGSTGSTGTTGGTSSTTGEPPGTTGTTAAADPPGTSGPSSTVPPQTAPPPASVPATTTTTPSTTAPRPGDPDQDATWDALAQCESGGRWSADTGNGRYGGLQISADTWRQYGGRGHPDDYSRETQIEVARRIQRDQGWRYWRDCARQLGYY